MRFYRALLRLYPKSFRAEYGDQILSVIAERRRDGGSRTARLALALETVADTLSTAGRVHAEILAQDVRYSARTLRRTPAFALTAILLTAVGIGATTAALAIADHVLLRPLPYAEPDRLVRFLQHDTLVGGTNVLSPGNYRDLVERAGSFETVAAYTSQYGNLVGHGTPVRLEGQIATVDLFQVLGRRATLGRTFVAADGLEDAPPVVVLSHRAWAHYFGSDADIVGRTLALNGTPHDVIGVMPIDFMFPDRATEFWAPLTFDPAVYEDRTNTFLSTVARLRPDRTAHQADAELDAIAADLERQFPDANARLGILVTDLRGSITRLHRQQVTAVAGAALGLLLIASTNLAGLLLSRGLSRRRELAVRAAIGAGRERLIRQMLTESFLIAAAGGLLGGFVAVLGTPLLARLVPTTLPLAETPTADWRFVAVAAGVTILTAFAFGVLPARRATAGTAPEALRESSRTGSGRRTEALRGGLVVAQVAVSVVLLVAVGLLAQALWNVQARDPGFDARGVLTLRTSLPWPKYGPTAERVAFYDRVLEEVRSLPGVQNAGFTTGLPMLVPALIWEVQAEGGATLGPRENTAGLRFVTSGYFEAMGIPLKEGRDISESDTRDSPFVAVVSESFARQHWPGQSAVGRRFNVAFYDRTVVGVVGDVAVRGLERQSEPQVYMAAPQVPDFGLAASPPKDLAVRASVPPATLLPAIRQIIHRADPEQPISNVRLLNDIVSEQTAPRSAQLGVVSSFAGAAILLAAIGLYGLLAFAVSTRAREIGLRMALGATPARVVADVVRRGAVLAGIGALIGTAAAWAAGRWLQAILAGVDPADPRMMAFAVALAVGAAIAATVPPALRASRISPLEAIRE